MPINGKYIMFFILILFKITIKNMLKINALIKANPNFTNELPIGNNSKATNIPS